MVVEFNCPHCTQKLQAEEEMRGIQMPCPQCNNAIQIPSADPLAEKPIQTPAVPPPLRAPKRAIDSVGLQERKHLTIKTTTNEITGQRIEKYPGIARGVVVRSPSSTESLLGGLKQIIGGNIETYARICEQARQEAFARMVENANQINADAVIAFRYDATEYQPGITEVLAYGTAVKLKSEE